MSWLFGKKKVPRVPLPQGKVMDQKSLNFSKKIPSEKIIEPDGIKKAAGVGDPKMPPVKVKPKKKLPRRIPKVATRPKARLEFVPSYINVGAYQKILGDFENLKGMVSELNSTSKKLEQSEYNEELKFGKLKRDIKKMHDSLLQADKILFKGD